MDREHGRCRRAARPCSRLRRETPTRRDRTFSTAREYGAPTCQEARTSRSPNLRICCLSWLDVSWSLGWRRPSCFSSRDFHRHQEPGYCESSTKLKLSSFHASLDYCHYKLSCTVITVWIVIFAVAGAVPLSFSRPNISHSWLGCAAWQLTPSHGHDAAKLI